MRRTKAYQPSWSRRKHRKLYLQRTRWNLGKHVKIYHGITARQHLTDPRQSGIADRAVRRVEEQYLQSLVQTILQDKKRSSHTRTKTRTDKVHFMAVKKTDNQMMTTTHEALSEELIMIFFNARDTELADLKKKKRVVQPRGR